MLRTVFRPEKRGALKNGRKFYSEALRDICALTDLISLMKSRRMKLADGLKYRAFLLRKGNPTRGVGGVR
jgi:hypothetical protein